MARKTTYKRRPNNSGTVVKLSGKRRKPYCARVLSNDRDLLTGRKKQVTIGTFETELEALNALSLYHMTSNREITKNEAKELNNDLYNKIQMKKSFHCYQNHQKLDIIHGSNTLKKYIIEK